MAKIISARAYANNEVALLAWSLDKMIDGCLGFDIVRIRTDNVEAPKPLPAWVPFPGQSNPNWKPQDTRVWPVQKLYWRDLTLRQHRSDLGRRDIGFSVKYSIRPVGDLKAGMEPAPVPPRTQDDYTGPVRPLGYLGAAVETNEVLIDLTADGVRATFTNGILAAQWLKHAIEESGQKFSVKAIETAIADENSKIRAYLTGDVLDTVLMFLTNDRYKDGDVRLALYELKDTQLVNSLVANKDRIEVILSNTSKEKDAATGADPWDVTNQKSRARLHAAGVNVHDRMFNNNHIGHNKFAVWRRNGVPKAVMTGSTNWTSNGLCAQSNNAFLIEDDNLATAYNAYWERLLADKLPPLPDTQHNGTVKQRQGPKLRTADQMPVDVALGQARLQAWFSPNTDATKKGTDAPPDLKALFDLMAKAKRAIFFLAFLPSVEGANSIISTAIEAGKADPNLFVIGAVSDAVAMPNYVPKDKKAGTPGATPYTFDEKGVHIVRAANVKDIVGDFEKEIPGIGHAIVHDKIVVIDPLSDDCVVAAGSHNLGFKASYENDENLIIMKGAKALAQAYAVHVTDVYEHYRFRAWQAEAEAAGRPTFDGHIQGDDKWLGALMRPGRRGLDSYFASR